MTELVKVWWYYIQPAMIALLPFAALLTGSFGGEYFRSQAAKRKNVHVRGSNFATAIKKNRKVSHV